MITSIIIITFDDLINFRFIFIIIINVVIIIINLFMNLIIFIIDFSFEDNHLLSYLTT